MFRASSPVLILLVVGTLPPVEDLLILISVAIWLLLLYVEGRETPLRASPIKFI